MIQSLTLRRFGLMWANRKYTGNMEIEICSTKGWAITMEFIADSTEQIFVRPARNADPATLRQAVLESVFVPAMSGLSEDLDRHFRETYPPAFIQNPLVDIPFIKNTKARKELLPPALDAAGLIGFPYTHYHEIAAVMKPEEIHPEIAEKLDNIMGAFGL